MHACNIIHLDMKVTIEFLIEEEKKTKNLRLIFVI